jgi:MFS family permease
MTQYRDHFQVELAGPQVSKIFSLYNAGSMVGALFAGPIADYFGRRVGMFAGKYYAFPFHLTQLSTS